jgi:hypothetical protein
MRIGKKCNLSLKIIPTIYSPCFFGKKIHQFISHGFEENHQIILPPFFSSTFMCSPSWYIRGHFARLIAWGIPSHPQLAFFFKIKHGVSPPKNAKSMFF